jgi:hypothetical protein
MLSIFLSISASNPFASPFLLLLSSNTGRLHLDHLQWQDDCLIVYFAHQKNDHQGKWAAFGWHLFCNPFNKYVCPVFFHSLWLALNEEMTMLSGPLFPGSNQHLWFNKFFRSFLNEHSQLVHACGCDPDLLGVHSFWKGALTFLSSGSTGGPTSGAIHQRAGWSQGKVNNTYILFERAGDQFIRRIISGLNIHQHTFAVLPPRFGVRGATDGVSVCVFVYLFFVPFLYVMPLTNPPTFLPSCRRLLRN